MVLVKTIILPDEYLVDDTELDSIMFALEKSYQYLGDDKFTITKSEDRIIVRVEVEENETLILNNIEFFDNVNTPIDITANGNFAQDGKGFNILPKIDGGAGGGTVCTSDTKYQVCGTVIFVID